MQAAAYSNVQVGLLPHPRSQQHRHVWPVLSRAALRAQANAKKPPAPAKVAAVRAKMSQAGLSDQKIDSILKAYPPYSNWDPDTKLRPAIDLWQRELGPKQFAERWPSAPHLLLHSPQERRNILAWLSGIGVNSDAVDRSALYMIQVPLASMQATADFLQVRLELTDQALTDLIRKSPRYLLCSPDHVEQCLQIMAELLGVPGASTVMRRTVISGYSRLLFYDPSRLAPGVMFFAQNYGNGQKAREAALLGGAYLVPRELLQSRAQHLQAKLSLSESELRTMATHSPFLLTKLSSTVDSNIAKFSSTFNVFWERMTILYKLDPSLLGLNWESKLQVQKVKFLRLVMQLDDHTLADHYKLLMTSLPKRLGPRFAFLQQLLQLGLLPQEEVASHVVRIYKHTDAVFASNMNPSAPDSPLAYTTSFQNSGGTSC